MLADSDRILQTVEQVLRQAALGNPSGGLIEPIMYRRDGWENACAAHTRYHLEPQALVYTNLINGQPERVKGDADERRAAVLNLLDNAVKYSDKGIRLSVEVAAFADKKDAVRVADSVRWTRAGAVEPHLQAVLSRAGSVMHA